MQFQNILMSAQLEASRDGILVLDEEGRIIFYNQRLVKIWGIPPTLIQDRIDESAIQFVAALMVNPDPFLHHVQELFQKSQEIHQEELLLLDGRVIDSYCTPLIGPDDSLLGRIWFFRNVTDRRHAEEELRKSMEKYWGIFDESITTIYLFDTNKKFIDANQAGLDLLGYSREELLNLHIADVDADPVVVLPAHQELLTGGRIIDYEHRLRREDGTILTVLNNSRSLTDAGGNVVGMLSTLLDITERKKAENELRRTHTLIDMIIENIPNMIFVKDAEYLRFVRFNKAGETLLGYPRESLLGKNDYDFFPKAQADFFTGKDRDVLRGKEVVDIPEEFLETRDKGTRILHTKKVPLLDVNGEAEYLLGISEDITDRKQAEESLHHTLEEKISLLKEVHHRVKNNLQIVISLLNLKANRSQSAEVFEVLQDMGNRVHSMALLHEILYRSDNLAQIHLADYVEKLCAQLLRSSGVENGRINVVRNVENISLSMEQAVPYSLIVNELVSNALKHAFPDGRSGEIRVSTRLTDDGQINLNIVDNGIGIASGDDPTQKTTLGLQLVSRLARQLRGRLAFGRGKDCGVCFNVDFPLPDGEMKENEP